MEGKTALVTGGARGIGRGIAVAFARAGARVMVGDLGDRDSSWTYDLAGSGELGETVALCREHAPAAATSLDVTSADSCAAAVAAAVSEFGALDVLVNNAGVVQSGAIEDFTEADWDRVFAVNSKGIFLMTRAALPALRNSADAAIINTASIAGKKGYPNMAAYCGSKFAAIGITQSFAAELAPVGIRVNAICPGMVGTAMWLEHLLPSNTVDADSKHAEFEAAMRSTIPLGRPQTAEDMGAAAVYLATAANVTGVSLNVAGGFEMH